jgi:hypothetical protein
MLGVNSIRGGGTAEDLDLHSAPGGFQNPEPSDFTKLHAGTPNVSLDRDNRIVFRTGTKAPVCTHSLVKVLKEELRRRKTARDPNFLQWYEYVSQLRDYLDQNVPYKEVIAIDRTVRTSWGAQGAAWYTEEMVDSVFTLHTLLNLR